MSRHVVILVALIVFADPSYAQPATIHGRVTDAESGQSIPGAHVFLAESMMGTTTDEEGYYLLRNLTPGAQRVVVSIVGYETMHAEIVAERGHLYRFDAALEEDVIEMESTEVVDYFDGQWRKYLEFFLQTFLGQTENASHATIRNLRALHMDTTRSFLDAWSSAPLEISSPALGYEIRYHLQHYRSDGSDVMIVGDPVFIEMEPESDQQYLEWENARCQAYLGSRRHFLRSLATQSSDRYGFDLSLLPSNRSVSERRIVGRGSTDEMRLLFLDNPLQVAYRHATESPLMKMPSHSESASASSHPPPTRFSSTSADAC